MNPLVIIGRGGKSIDPRLVDLDPGTGAEIGANQGVQVGKALHNGAHG
jgi:hypothetical protein